MTLEENQLVIRGRQTDDKTRHFLHRGIAARQFQRAFLLVDGMEVLGADLSNGRLSGSRAKVVTSTIERLLVKLRPHALDLVDAFGFDDEHLRAPIASGAEGRRQAEAMAYYEAQRAAGTLPTPEKQAKRG